MQVKNGTNRRVFVITAALFLCLYIAQTYMLASNHDLIERKAEVASGNATLASEGIMYICEREEGIENEYAFLCRQAEQIAQNPVQPVAGEKGDVGASCVEELGLEACRGDRGDKGDPPPPEEVRAHLEDVTPRLIEPIVTSWLGDNPPPASTVAESDLESQFIAFCAARNDCQGDDGRDGINGTDGRDGTNGTDGRDGESIVGPRGVGIANISCPEKNLMVISLTDGKTFRFAIPCHTVRR
jgi:hypothetical protein